MDNGMENRMDVRTDLALETQESFVGQGVEISGVLLDERYENDDIKITKVEIVNEEGAKAMNKPKGVYVTIEAEELLENDGEYYKKVGKILAKEIKSILPDNENLSVLVVGLGNREITSDALGPIAVSNISATRHINELYGYNKVKKSVSALVPGVMSQSGMEAANVIKGVVNETKPDVIIAIDALAARNIKRLNTTIQLTNTGINPGSGVGNHRNAINYDSMGVLVMAIGVPTIIDGSAFVEGKADLILTLKDIDENIVLFGKMIAESINSAMSE